MEEAIKFIAGWLLLLVILYGIAQTSWGRTIAYYVLWLSIVLLLVNSADELATVLDWTGLTPGSQPNINPGTFAHQGASSPNINPGTVATQN